MNYYEDNHEGLEPEDYIDEYGEAGHSAWDFSYQKRTIRKSHSQQNISPHYDEGDALLGIIIFIVILFLLMIFIFA